MGWDLNIISSEEAEAKVKVDETEFLASLISSLEISEEIAEKIASTGLSSFDDIAYAEDEIFKSFIEDEAEIARVKSAAEDAALLEAMGDELQEIIEISSDDASKMIMKAREHWFN